MLDAMDHARDHIEYYVFEDVQVHGMSLSELLANRLAAGVAVNIIYDASKIVIRFLRSCSQPDSFISPQILRTNITVAHRSIGENTLARGARKQIRRQAHGTIGAAAILLLLHRGILLLHRGIVGGRGRRRRNVGATTTFHYGNNSADCPEKGRDSRKLPPKVLRILSHIGILCLSQPRLRQPRSGRTIVRVQLLGRPDRCQISHTDAPDCR